MEEFKGGRGKFGAESQRDMALMSVGFHPYTFDFSRVRALGCSLSGGKKSNVPKGSKDRFELVDDAFVPYIIAD